MFQRKNKKVTRRSEKDYLPVRDLSILVGGEEKMSSNDTEKIDKIKELINRADEGACLFCGDLGDEDEDIDGGICSKCDDKGLGGDGELDTFLMALTMIVGNEEDEEEEEE